LFGRSISEPVTEGMSGPLDRLARPCEYAVIINNIGYLLLNLGSRIEFLGFNVSASSRI
jgi:hypothetical protein